MASVAICPHCYLQLVVPDGVESDERVECPTCAKEFGLDQAVLRAIPEVVRRSRAAEPIEGIEETAAVEDIVADVMEVDEIIVESDGEREADVIEGIKARIEAEIAENGLPTGTNTLLPLELPAEKSVESGDSVESSPVIEQVEGGVAAWFRHADTVPELPSLDLSVDAKTQVAHRPWRAVETEDAMTEDVLEQAEVVSDVVPEPAESPVARPAATTLADLMPPREELEVADEIDAAPGPSFDLPNVPLVPPNGATVEIDPSMSFGPAAETEFELDDVDFEATPVEEPVADEAAEANEPVFSEPDAAAIPAAPFVLPRIPRAKTKRSVVRTLVEVALGGVVSLPLGYFILLYALGPEGDFLQVAKYLPSAVLPTSFGNSSTQISAAVAKPKDNASSEESVNVPAGYTEEAKAPAESTATYESPNDDRYNTEPSPLDEPAAEPIAEDTASTTFAPLPIRGPTFTVEQLATALEAGKAAQTGLVAGDLSDASVRRTKGMSYAKLCDLAEALTFVDRSSPSVESEQAVEGADRLFRETLADAHARNEVARIAQIWFDSPHRAHGGIFLAGNLSGGQIAGDVYEYELATGDSGKLTLLFEGPLDPMVEGSGHPVGIVGSIVENPAEQVAGYSGTAERAIWVARAIPLD
jgi:hypothetical protein